MAVAYVQSASGMSGASSVSMNVALPAAPTAGNLLVFTMGGDKDTGALTLTGFTELYSLLLIQ